MRKIIAFAFLMLAMSAQGQLINVEKKRVMGKNGVAGSITLGGSWVENVNRIVSFENNITLQYARGAHLFMILNDIDIIQVNDDNLANHGYQHVRYNYTFKDSSAITLELFAQHQDDKIKKLEQRIITGGGFRFRLIHTDYLYLYFAPLVMYEHEQYTENVNPTFDYFKLDAYLVMSVRLADKLKFSTITYYQPAFSDWSKFRIAHDSGLDIPLVKNLKFRASFNFTYDSYPGDEIPEVFSKFKNSIRYNF